MSAGASSLPASTVPYWGRAWELDVYNTPDGSGTPTIISSSAWEPEALRVTFNIEQASISSPWWFADIDVYNVNNDTLMQALFNAQWVVLKAGYQSSTLPTADGGQTSLTTIWSGVVMQPLYTREGVVDTKLTYHCLAFDPKLIRNVNFTMGRNATQAQVVARMAGLVPSMGTVNADWQETLSQNSYARQRSYFGVVDKYFDRTASGNNMQWFKAAHGTYLGQLLSPLQEPDVVYSPPPPPPPLPPNWNLTLSPQVSYTVLDTPQQTDSGIQFKVLLDPRLIVQIPPLLVKMDNTVIQQIKLQFPQTSGLYPLAADNMYVVSAVCHRGDTRGNEWCTEVTGYTRNYALLGARGITLTGG